MSANIICSAVLDWVKEGASKGGGVSESMGGEEVIYWALCLTCAWMVLISGACVTKWMIGECFKRDEEEGEVGEDYDKGGEADEAGAVGGSGVEYKCEVERGRPCEGEEERREGEEDSMRSKAKVEEKGRKKNQVVADDSDPCMPDNREWGEW